jgi:hypothetical protein
VSWDEFQSILPVLTLAIGYAGTFATERLRDRNEVRRAHATAILDFERNLLLDTQAAVYQCAGELQDFAFALRGEADRPYAAVVGSTWRASAHLEMLATRLESDLVREAIGDVLAAGHAIVAGAWPGDDDWTDADRDLLDKLVDHVLECEARASGLLGDRVRAVMYASSATKRAVPRALRIGPRCAR